MSAKSYWDRTGNVLPYSKTAWAINQAYYFDGFIGAVVEGVQRIGKTAYVCKALAQAYGEWSMRPCVHCESMNYEKVKHCLTFLPKEYLQAILNIKNKERGLIMDDAGFWLFALDWYDPFVKSVNRFFQVGGTKLAFIGLTSPSKKLISGKVLDALPEMKIIQIIRNGKDGLKKRPRMARVYQKWEWVDGKHGGVKLKWSDTYDAMLPDPFYNWYTPKRQNYVAIGERLMATEIWKLEKRQAMEPKEKEAAMEVVHEVVGGDETLRELNEVLQNLEKEKLAAKDKIKLREVPA